MFTGASDAKPIGCGSPGGFSTVNRAGSRVMLVKNAMIMPQPAIWPSSERPWYEVGRNEENPRAVAAAASAMARQPCAKRCAARGEDRRTRDARRGAHTELQPEIDAQADEQHEKRDRDDVQRADQEEAEGSGDRQTNAEADRHREDDPRGVEREP